MGRYDHQIINIVTGILYQWCGLHENNDVSAQTNISNCLLKKSALTVVCLCTAQVPTCGWVIVGIGFEPVYTTPIENKRLTMCSSNVGTIFQTVNQHCMDHHVFQWCAHRSLLRIWHVIMIRPAIVNKMCSPELLPSTILCASRYNFKHYVLIWMFSYIRHFYLTL